MTSQKAEALAKYTKAHEAGMMSGYWKPLSTIRSTSQRRERVAHLDKHRVEGEVEWLSQEPTHQHRRD